MRGLTGSSCSNAQGSDREFQFWSRILHPNEHASAQKTHLRLSLPRSLRPPLKYTNLQMSSTLSRLRRWFAGATIAAILLVAGAYFYARHRIQNALQQVPAKIGLEIKQSATGFTVSKSEQGRTLFT